MLHYCKIFYFLPDMIIMIARLFLTILVCPRVVDVNRDIVEQL